jgi:protease PrsW
MELILLSILPVVIIMIYIYYRDKYEKEPFKTLFKAFAGGILAVIATLVVVLPLSSLSKGFEDPFTTAFTGAFLEAAIPEEFFKFIFLYWFIWKDKNFNEKFDGIVYAVFVSLGFACVENIAYVVDNGIGVGIARGILAVPGHALFGVIMGYYFSLARFTPLNKRTLLFKSLGYAILAHGLYDFLLMYGSGMADVSPLVMLLIFVLFFVFIFLLWRLGFRKIKSLVDASQFRTETVKPENK